MESNRHDMYDRSSSLHRPNPSSQDPFKENDRESSSEPFSPIGLLGERYDLLRQQMEARSRVTERNNSPFTRGLLGSLAESGGRGYRPSYDSSGSTGGIHRAPSTASSSNRHGPRRTPSVSSVRTDSMYCAQSGVTPPPLLDISSALPQRRPSWRDQNSQDVRSPTGQPPLSLPEGSSTQWENRYPPALSRSHSAAVRSSSGPSGSGSGLHATPASSTPSRRVSTATATHGNWAEPKRRGTLRRC
ncbi:hypothetical protein FVEG_09354 [Fusarium verticillioides 7600]|uniref:Uncharacterized protein n=1 Tax=Gibberella moniliformis (strain M3125 / FGSC 7600) TaxID=334819 RepID=W7MGL9_GIBM7|nr:hypothetical protein FVEG_09354 [Fusarium verticillioides 7600]EWG50016.1 hypothetical protein FVEG_09354 [Fusarium verticillioides 7600]